MKIRMRTQYSGPAGSFAPGAVVDFPNKEAKALLEGGYAEALAAAPKAKAPEAPPKSGETAQTKPGETATVKPNETATTKAGENATAGGAQTAPGAAGNGGLRPVSKSILITPPDDEVVSLDEAKAQLRVTGTDEDAIISAMLGACVAQLDPAGGGWLGRALRPQTWELRLDGFPCGAIKVPFPPLIEIASFVYDDAAGVQQSLTDGAGFRVIDGGLAGSDLLPVFGGSWPAARCDVGSVRIRFSCGYPVPQGQAEDTLPVPIKQALFLMLRQVYDMGARSVFLSGETVFGVGSSTYFANGNSDQVLAATKALLAGYRVDWF
jgi:uncharacterized phiE125 gp8 family phage protein